jgi:palmitoyltransferase ZDHHC9/14/18
VLWRWERYDRPLTSDHHCSYLHTCVGKRNYLAFLVLLISAVGHLSTLRGRADIQTISDIYIVVFSAIHFSLLCSHDNISFKAALQDSPGAAVSFLLGVLVLPAICFLLWYHIRVSCFILLPVQSSANPSSSCFTT